MNKPSLLLAAGCSWVSARAIDTDPELTTYDYNHIEDPTIVEQYSFAGLLKKKLVLDQIHILAEHGSSNDKQFEKLIDYIDNNLENYSKIYVLWGITSIYRWEMFSNSTKQVQTCIIGRGWKNLDLKKETEYYFSHFWNKEYELKKLGTKVIAISGYLKNLNIDHLFFNAFQSYNNIDLQITNIDTKNFYQINEIDNDMVSFLCKEKNIKINKSNVPWLNTTRFPVSTQFNNRAIKDLQKITLLDQATAHPTIEGHQLIADELYRYIENNK